MNVLCRIGNWTATVLVGLACLTICAHAEVVAHLGRTQIKEGEQVELRIEVKGKMSSEAPDLSPLEDDFQILHTGQSSEFKMTNGTSQSSVKWTVVLLPKRTGALQIPALTVEGEQTDVLNLNVLAEADFQAGGTPDLFVETEIDTPEPYVQGMVRYTVKVFLGVSFGRYGMSEPQLDNAVVLPLGQDREARATRNGRDYVVIERSYAIFPQESGSLRIPPVVFETIVPVRGRVNPFFGTQQGQRMRKTGEEQTLNVKPRPSSVTGRHWLPARALALEDNWEPDTDEVQAGQPLTRTITIRAVGLTGEQLPDIDPDRIDGLNVYADAGKPETQASAGAVANGGGVTGARVQSIAYVPSKEGTYDIPPVRISWWDVEADKARVAELPGRTVTVTPAPAGSSAAPAPQSQGIPGFQIRPGNRENADAALPLATTRGQAARHAPSTWMWVSAGLTVLWLGTLGLWYWERSRRQSAPVKSGTPPSTAGDSGARGRFLSACKQGDATGARRDLMAWAKSHWPDNPPSGLEEVAGRLGDDEQKKLVLELNRALYGDGAASWDGTALARALTSLPHARRRGAKSKSVLPDLYA